ncbi:MAG: hypothetical protein KJ971_02090 [Firmicutes bacterium]|nr:hypothetical protein [Bacillota bacterium]
MFLTDWTIVIEVSLIILFLIGSIVVASFLIVRSLIYSYKDVFKAHSKFDIELRKSLNLISKVVKDESLKAYDNVIIKELNYEEKKKLLTLVDFTFLSLNSKEEADSYLAETYENLQELRRIRDSKVLIFNQKILMFPFNIYSKIMKMKKWDVFTS